MCIDDHIIKITGSKGDPYGNKCTLLLSISMYHIGSINNSFTDPKRTVIRRLMLSHNNFSCDPLVMAIEEGMHFPLLGYTLYFASFFSLFNPKMNKQRIFWSPMRDRERERGDDEEEGQRNNYKKGTLRNSIISKG